MMLNKITLVSCLLFFIFGSQTFAHSHLETNTTPPAQVETNKEIETAAPDTKAVMKEESTEVNKISEKPSVMNYVLPAIMGLIIVLGFGSYWLIYRRKYV
ncbi:hypothetical protein V7075_01280 [Neobacillus drentensis]|uniref:hypothetical protein n=1 Tax=Neobacillus drentensis TaxID=220684 RepID=UPI002FFF432E